jgi:uncharacterized protein YebE (UPF0316 family)
VHRFIIAFEGKRRTAGFWGREIRRGSKGVRWILQNIFGS